MYTLVQVTVQFKDLLLCSVLTVCPVLSLSKLTAERVLPLQTVTASFLSPHLMMVLFA